MVSVVFRIVSKTTILLAFLVKVHMCFKIVFVFCKIQDALYLTVQQENAKHAKVVIDLLQQVVNSRLKTVNHGLLWEIVKIVKDYISWILCLSVNLKIQIVKNISTVIVQLAKLFIIYLTLFVIWMHKVAQFKNQLISVHHAIQDIILLMENVLSL